MQQFFEDSRIIEPLHQGPLTEHFGSYTLLLKQQGYSRSSAQAEILLISRFSQIYLDAGHALKEQILAKIKPLKGIAGRYQLGDALLTYLKGLGPEPPDYAALRRSLPLDSTDSKRGTLTLCTPMRHISGRGIVQSIFSLAARRQ
jgi:hypothetical protein